jgi:hypothetical protein
MPPAGQRSGHGAQHLYLFGPLLERAEVLREWTTVFQDGGYFFFVQWDDGIDVHWFEGRMFVSVTLNLEKGEIYPASFFALGLFLIF